MTEDEMVGWHHRLSGHEIEIYASMDPAREVGGDFYDYYFVDDDHLCLVISDVSGKGVPGEIGRAHV